MNKSNLRAFVDSDRAGSGHRVRDDVEPVPTGSCSSVSVLGNVFLPVTGSKLDLIISMIQNSYVDTVDTRQIVENTIPVLLKDLDPHTVYIPAKDMQRANEGIVGNFGGSRNPVLQVSGHRDCRESSSGWSFGESRDKGRRPDCSGERFFGCQG